VAHLNPWHALKNQKGIIMTQIIQFPTAQSRFGFTPKSRSKPASILEGPGLIDRIDLIQQIQDKAILPLMATLPADALKSVFGGQFYVEWSSLQKCVRVPKAAESIKEADRNSRYARQLLDAYCESAVDYEDHVISSSREFWLFSDIVENGNAHATFFLAWGSRSIKWEEKDAIVPISEMHDDHNYSSLRVGIDAIFAFLDEEPKLQGLSFCETGNGEVAKTKADFINWLYHFSKDTNNGYMSRLQDSLRNQLNIRETA
jgi:hypothetical protein